MPIPHSVAFLIPTLALNLTPGPDMFFVIGRASRGGPRAALSAAAGLWIGYLLHIALVCLGLATLLPKFPAAFLALKYMGAAYLLFLGVKLLLASAGNTLRKETQGSGLMEGIFVSALNPKVAIFFLAFLPQFVNAGDSNVTMQLALLGLVFSITSTIINFGAGMLAHIVKNRNKARKSRRFSLEQACGLAMVGIAVKLTLLR